MSKGQLVINCVLAVAVAALFYVFFSSPRKTKSEEVQISGEHLPIAKWIGIVLIIIGLFVCQKEVKTD